ncbi:MAG: RNA-binding S4 domain-containing protein [Bacteroidales bacterium]|nr:RNA-binding S4 domain-containing protein [Bacteroidales bacterium]MBN2758343.1 RNA-binding S4 domain-containing protein [Bacteroidales bacterium]
MDKEDSVRIDKYLWSVRLFKTRSLAAEACKKERVLMNSYPLKSSRIIKVGDVFEVKINPVIYKYRVKELLHNRVGAKLVENYLEDLTDKVELENILLNSKMTYLKRDRGTGRPTKKDRREIEKLNPES